MHRSVHPRSRPTWNRPFRSPWRVPESVCLRTPSSAAQQPHQVRAQGTVEERAKSQADKINSTVQLSADQYTKVLDLTKNFIGQKDAVRSSGAQGDDMKTKFKAIREQEEAQLKAILTADQFAKLQAARKDHEGHRPE